MQDIEGVYKIEMLGPYGWERFSTAFLHDGQYRGASADHYTAGIYEVDGKEFRMLGNITQHVDYRALFGHKHLRGLPIEYHGTIGDRVIDGKASVNGDGRYSTRFRLSRLGESTTEAELQPSRPAAARLSMNQPPGAEESTSPIAAIAE